MITNSISGKRKVDPVHSRTLATEEMIMQRIEALSPANAPAASAAMLEAVKKQIGMVPNLFKTFAHSPAVLGGYLKQTEALGGGVLPASLREQLAVAIAGQNHCSYCASAHTLMGKGAGVAVEELSHNLQGQSGDAKTQAAIDFAKALLNHRGQMGEADFAAVRAAGFGDAEIVEIIAHVGVNVFTNYFNNAVGTVIDFPVVSAETIRAAA